ncbi:MAG: ABC transporter permease [Halanaerobiales bacterium]|jgi:peptide/nickel transport system permease protein|nr:ABC transporter permease [Bacillota bacterium]HOA41650.1 ABC transporter permease [Halanaerobiales bacterium]HPZ63768.1 ABC transporter permease [Halanaerobiales bacterium]HQD04986.1 ABC transporter permease [Halanaerobiales bacterium]
MKKNGSSFDKKTDKKASSRKDSRLKEFKRSAKEFWQEFKQVRYGIVGLILLIFFVLMVLLEPFIIPFPEAGDRWSDISYWIDNPRSASPAWTNWFSSKKSTVHEFLSEPEFQVTETPQFQVQEGTFIYDYKYDIPPGELTLKARGKGNIVVEAELIRPDGEVINLVRKNYNSRNETEIRIALGKEAETRIINFGRTYESAENSRSVQRHLLKPMEILFSKAEEGILVNAEPLKGEYQIKLRVVTMGQDSYFKDSEIVVSGKVFGLLGTDDAKRDIWSGIVVGTKWAIFIGLLTALVSVAVGIIYGVTMAYFGGWLDNLMMRIYEIFVSIPMLPVLVVFSAVFSPSLWILILFMCVFYWTGPVLTVRSMALQIKEETYIEAAHALNASTGRIIFKHMIPQLIPYAFANMALSVPGAIVAEASISLLGLGDASVVTWGQILHAAMKSSAVLKGLWWWVVPPGLTIALLGMTFAFLGFSMDKILNPKLKTR